MNKETKRIATITGIILGAFGIVYVASKVIKPKKPFEAVRAKGATPFKTESGQEGISFGDYQFYPNNRVMQKSTKRMGSYDHKDISWDDGAEQKLSEIFKK